MADFWNWIDNTGMYMYKGLSVSLTQFLIIDTKSAVTPILTILYYGNKP